MNVLILVIAIWGLLLSAMAHGCALGYVESKETKFFGTSIPWVAIGVVGYAIIAATAWFPPVTKVLAVIVAITTLYLIVKGIKLKLACPFCVMVWLTNIAFVVCAFLPKMQES